MPAQAFYGFIFQGETFVITTVPTGGRHIPALAQALIHSLALRAVERANVPVIPHVYIDNVRFAGIREQALAVHHVFIAEALNVGLTLNDECLTALPIEEYDFLGVHLKHLDETSHLPATRTIGAKTTAKLSTWRQCDLKALTLREVLRLLGVLVFASRCISLPLADFLLRLQICAKTRFGTVAARCASASVAGSMSAVTILADADTGKPASSNSF